MIREDGRRGRGKSSWNRITWLLRTMAAALMIFLAVLLLIFHEETRLFEAQAASTIASIAFADSSVANSSTGTPYFAYSLGDQWYLLRITAECGIGLYIAGLLLLTSALSFVRKIVFWRLVLALALASFIFIGLNQARFLLLAAIFSSMGRASFNIAHSLGGSALMLSGMAIALLLFVRIAVRRESSVSKRIPKEIASPVESPNTLSPDGLSTGPENWPEADPSGRAYGGETRSAAGGKLRRDRRGRTATDGGSINEDAQH